MDRNEIILVGKCSYKYKEGKSVNGEPYLWFPMNVENKANTTENNFHQGLNIMVFKPNVINYLKKVGLRPGNHVVVFGFIAAFKQEIKGKAVVSHAINGVDVYVTKTRSDKDIFENYNKQQNNNNSKTTDK